MDKLINIIAEACDNDIVKKNRDINLFETGLLDSMNFIEMLVEIEEEYDIEIDPIKANRETMSTPNAIISYVEKMVDEL